MAFIVIVGRFQELDSAVKFKDIIKRVSGKMLEASIARIGDNEYFPDTEMIGRALEQLTRGASKTQCPSCGAMHDS